MANSIIIILTKEHAEMLRDTISDCYDTATDVLNDNVRERLGGKETLSNKEEKAFLNFRDLHRYIYSQIIYQGIPTIPGEINEEPSS